MDKVKPKSRKDTKPAAKNNKAEDVETNPKTDALWASFGKLQAQREQHVVAINQHKQAIEQLSSQMRRLYEQINEISRK